MRLYHLLVYEDPAWRVACQAGFFRARFEGSVQPAIPVGTFAPVETIVGMAGGDRPYFPKHTSIQGLKLFVLANCGFAKPRLQRFQNLQ